jgi:molybdopterin/thiamine biosynthesis adenylyltransferase
MHLSLEQLAARSASKNQLFQPQFFRIHGDQSAYQGMSAIANDPATAVFDDLYNQLKELIKSRNPGRSLDRGAMDTAIKAHVGSCPMAEYGVWVHYPWSGRLVHLLDEQEFVELRTSANKNKISIPERDVLATKKVGVIGLSVGQSVSVTLAMERGCGELRLADYDTLELNNLNRIRTGVHNLGLLKVYSVAREIAEIDPYLKVVCYPEGITEQNIHDFFTDNGKLDLVIDECDGVNVKILCRLKAKELQVPVLMEASDRGTLDIERFDLEPDRPIVHGWLAHLSHDMEVLKNLKTNEQKLPYMLPIAGFSTLSNRMKASLLELNYSITTWPQLATAVTLGGAITADTARRIFLGQLTTSGRFFVDMEQIVPEPAPAAAELPPLKPQVQLKSNGQSWVVATDLAPYMNIDYYNPTAEEVQALVADASAAESFGNLQPWLWHYKAPMLLASLAERELSYLDVERITSALSLGRAIERLALSANRKALQVNILPIAGRDIACGYAIAFLPAADRRNTSFVAHESTCEVPQQSLIDIVEGLGSLQLSRVASGADCDELKELIAISERMSLLEPASHHDFFHNILRWPESQHQTGLLPDQAGWSGAETFTLRVVQDPAVAKLLAAWPNGGRVLENASRRQLAHATEFGIVYGNGSETAHYVDCGRLIERLSARYALEGYALHLWQTPIVHIRNYFANKDGLPEQFHIHCEKIMSYLVQHAGNKASSTPLCVFQLNKVVAAETTYGRKGIAELLSFAE